MTGFEPEALAWMEPGTREFFIDGSTVAAAFLTARRRRAPDPRRPVRWLTRATWGATGGWRDHWHGAPGASRWRRAARTLAGLVLGLPFVCRPVRAVAWRRINPELEEIGFGTTFCVLRDLPRRGEVFKVALNLLGSDAAAQERWIAEARADHAALRKYLGDHLAPTRFERRDLGGAQARWACGAVQPRLDGTPWRPQDLGRRPVEPQLRRQWREICVAALAAERATGCLLDALGRDNVLIVREAGGRARLVVVDPLPVPRHTPGQPVAGLRTTGRRVLEAGMKE